MDKKKVLIITALVIIIFIIAGVIVLAVTRNKKSDGKIEKETTQETTEEKTTEKETTTEQPTTEIETTVVNTAPDTSSNTSIARPSTSGRLHVQGQMLVDEKGNSALLMGMSTHGLAWFPQYVNQDFFNQLSGWNANVVRLAMYTNEYGGYCSGGDMEALKQTVINGVEFAKNSDMYVIIDWHTLTDNNPQQYQNQAVDFFNEMSMRFAGYNNVIYEICNEPNSDTTWSQVKEYANTVIPVIRANDSSALILVGTPNYCKDLSEVATNPIDDNNVMYTFHFYAASHKTSTRQSFENAIQQGVAVFVSEFGICDASGNGYIDEAEADKWWNLLDKYQISRINWSISNKEEAASMFNSWCTKTLGFTAEDFSQSGAYIYNKLQNRSK